MNGAAFGIFLLLFLIVMVGGLALLVVGVVRAGRRRRADRAAPVLERPATVTSRRADERPSRSDFPSRFYATFEFADASRAEYLLPDGRPAYSQLVEGAPGVLVTEGSRFLAFRPGASVQDRTPGSAG